MFDIIPGVTFVFYFLCFVFHSVLVITGLISFFPFQIFLLIVYKLYILFLFYGDFP